MNIERTIGLMILEAVRTNSEEVRIVVINDKFLIKYLKDGLWEYNDEKYELYLLDEVLEKLRSIAVMEEDGTKGTHRRNLLGSEWDFNMEFFDVDSTAFIMKFVRHS
jgi:hypothetical protein